MSIQATLPPTLPAFGQSRSLPTLRTIGALVLREMTTRFGRRPGGYVWALLQPLGVIIVMAFAFSLLSRSPALGTSFLLFKATGMMVFQMFRITSRTVGNSLGFSRALLSYPGVTWLDAVLARFILNALVTVLVTIIILTGVVLFEGLRPTLDWSSVVLSMVLAALLGLGFGTLNAFLFERFDIWENIWNILSAPLLIISGVLMLYENLPQIAQEWLWYNPLLHLTGMMREGFYSTYHPQYISISLVTLSALVPLVLGLILLRRHHRELLTR